MLEFIRGLIQRHRLERMRRLLATWHFPEPPLDPYAPVRHPRSRPPDGRRSAAAVEEPREVIVDRSSVARG